MRMTKIIGGLGIGSFTQLGQILSGSSPKDGDGDAISFSTRWINTCSGAAGHQVVEVT